jgi:hypothetical protein
MSRKIVLSLFAAVAVMLVVSVVQGAPAAPKAAAPVAPPAPPVYIVVEKKDLLGVISYESLDSKQLAPQQKQLHDQYVTALAKWTKDKADAAKNKQKFDQPKPLVPSMIRVLDTPIYQTQELAKEEVDKLTKKMEDAKKKAQEAKDAAAAGKTTDKPPSTPPTGKVEQAPPPDTTGDTTPPKE